MESLIDNKRYIHKHTQSQHVIFWGEPTIGFWIKESHLTNLLEFFKEVIVHKNKSHQVATGYCSLQKAFDKAFTKNPEENLSWHQIKEKFIKSMNDHLKE